MLTSDMRQRDFPSLEGASYLNTAAEGIPPRAVIDALAQYAEDKLLGMDGKAKLFVVFEDLFGSLSGSDVVVAFVEDDEFGFVGQDDAMGKFDGVGGLRAAEAAVDYGQVGEGFTGSPHANAGGADKQNGVSGE